MRKILTIFSRDIKSGIRDWLILYLIIAPIMIAFILSLVIPGVSDTNLNIVMTKQNNSINEYLNDFANIEYVDSLEKINERVLKMDDVFGLVPSGDSYKIIAQGNENASMTEALQYIIVNHLNKETSIPISVEISDIGWRESPIKLEATSILLLFTSVFGGMLIMLNLVEEKMSNTLNSINVTTVSRLEFVIGKSLLGFIVPIIGSIGAVIILHYTQINYLHLIVTMLALGLTSVVIGFAIGVYNNEPIAAIASMKGVFMPLILSVAGAMFLSDKLQFLLFWSPFYWAYKNIKDLLLYQASLGQIMINNIFILVISCSVFIILRKRISKGFN